MSTQHPDNVTTPFFCSSSVIGGEDEIREAYYVFSHLGCGEQMWDCEGKEVDTFVVKKLLTNYEAFFRDLRLGEDLFLTLRVPNPNVEEAEGKVLLETLESIPRSFDAARLFYDEEIAPIFEVILPMTMSARSLNRVYHLYRRFVVGKQHEPFYEGDIPISEWMGPFQPEEINVIPLFEDRQYLLQAHEIVREYLKDKDLPYQRVFLARSDPALNYGASAAVLSNKIALQRLHALEEEISVDLLPIIGVGSAPFRGNLKPTNPENCLEGYPSVQTFTLQSAFKYDYPLKEVENAVQTISASKRRPPLPVDEAVCLRLIETISETYQEEVREVAPLVNSIARYVPRRRLRKLHIGLFGYSRRVGDLSLPRAIGYCASLYSLGLPPELLGLSSLTPRDLEDLREAYGSFDEDLAAALPYFNERVLGFLSEGLRKRLEKALSLVEVGEPNEEHRAATDQILSDLGKERYASLGEAIIKAGWVRGFLG
jgi:phosphoenolpyruvate carboxylase